MLMWSGEAMETGVPIAVIDDWIQMPIFLCKTLSMIGACAIVDPVFGPMGQKYAPLR